MYPKLNHKLPKIKARAKLSPTYYSRSYFFILQEKFSYVDSIPRNVIELGFSPEIKKLLVDIEELFSVTGKCVYPLGLLPMLTSLITLGLYQYYSKDEDAFIFAYLSISVGLGLTLLICIVLYLIQYYTWNYRSKQMTEILDTFNAYSKPYGLYVAWNEDYQIYCHFRSVTKITCKRPNLAELEPQLLFKMDVVARQKYCNEKGLDFELP